MAEPSVESEWPREDIPDTDRLFMRIHQTHLKKNGAISAGAFVDRGDAMSTDWEKYSNAEQTRDRATRNPELNGVVAMNVGRVRDVDSPRQEVIHTPNCDLQNRAHTDVRGEKTDEVRLNLKRIAEWVIEAPNKEQSE